MRLATRTIIALLTILAALALLAATDTPCGPPPYPAAESPDPLCSDRGAT